MYESTDNLLVEQGIITYVSENFIEVTCQSKVDCKRCVEGKGCGGGILARWLGDRQHQIKIRYEASKFSPKLNSVAKFSFSATLIVKLAAITYGLPLLLLAVVLLFSHSLLSEVQSIGIGFILLGSGFFLSRIIVKKLMLQGLLEPNLLSVKNGSNKSGSNEYVCSLDEINLRTNKV